MGFTEANRRGNFPGKSRECLCFVGFFCVFFFNTTENCRVLIALEISSFSAGFCLWNCTNNWYSIHLGREVLFTRWTGYAICIFLLFASCRYKKWGVLKGNRLCLHSLAVLKSVPEQPGLQRWVEVGAGEALLREVNRRAWAGERHVCGTALGGQCGTQCPSGRSLCPRVHLGTLPVIWEPSHYCHLADALSPACVGSGVLCHEGKWHLSRAFFSPAFPAGAAESNAGCAEPSAGVLAGVQRGHRHTDTEASKTPSFGPSPVTLLASLWV